MKKFLSFLLTAVMVIAMSMPAFAEPTEYTITITEPENSSVSMAGNKYSAYKLFDATYNEEIGSYAYTLADAFQDFKYTPENEDEIGGDALVEHIQDLGNLEVVPVDKLNAFSKAVNNYIKNNAQIQASASATAEEGAKSVTIAVPESGYYVVTGTATAQGDNQTVTALCALTSATPDASITLKADAPQIEKDILVEDANGNETEVDTNTASIGDKVNYQLTSNVPKMDGYNKYFFILKDTLSAGLTFNEDTPEAANTVITIGGTTLIKDEDYVITYNADANTVEIVFRNFIQYAAQVGDEIIIKYSATINEDAVIGNTGNTNTVDLTYSNDPTFDYEGAGNPEDPDDPDNDKPGTDEPVGETPEEVVITYVTGIDLIKIDDNKNRLTGAEFQIKGEKLNQVIIIKDEFTIDDNGTYYELTDGTYTETEPTTATQDDYVDGTTKYTKTSTEEIIETTETVQATGIVGEDGVLRFDGLAEGEYIITELKAPDGFNILKNSIKVTISCELPDPIAEGTEQAKWSYTTCEVDENGNTVGKVEDSKPATDGRIELEIVNLTGAELPETGGIGTTIFTVAGIILMLGAVVLLVTKRKMSAKEL